MPRSFSTSPAASSYPAGPTLAPAAPWALFWVGLAVRLGWITFGHTYRFPPYLDHFSFAWEAGHIARALATGYGYADPFLGHTGPTAWLAPGYPLLLAGIFKLFGVFTPLSGWTLLSLGAIANAATSRLVWSLAYRSFGRSVAGWSAWIWALLPSAMQYAVRFPWETAISCSLFTWMLLATLRLRDHGSLAGWARWGALWGAILLFNPALGIFLPFAGCWLLWSPNQPGPRATRLPRLALATAICLCMLLPWWVRNERVMHAFVPLRSNAGVEMCLGNCYGTEGSLLQWEHPFLDPVELAAYRDLGELQYSAQKMRQVQAIVRQRPGLFAAMCLLRMDYYWFAVPHGMDHPLQDLARKLAFSFVSVSGGLGAWLALRRRHFGAGLFLLALLAVPIPAYFVIVLPRFRHPLEPLITILAVFLFQSAEKSWQVCGITLAGLDPDPKIT